MCGGCKNCKGCNGSNADGATYDVAQVKALVNKYFAQPSEAALNEAYKYTMVYFDFKKLPPTEENFIKMKDELGTILKEPTKLKQMIDEYNASLSKGIDYKKMLLPVAVIAAVIFLLSKI